MKFINAVVWVLKQVVVGAVDHLMNRVEEKVARGGGPPQAPAGTSGRGPKAGSK